MKLFDIGTWNLNNNITGFTFQILKFKRVILFEFNIEKNTYGLEPTLMIQLSPQPLFEIILSFHKYNLSFHLLAKNYDY